VRDDIAKTVADGTEAHTRSDFRAGPDLRGRDLLLEAMMAYARQAPQSEAQPVSSLEVLYRDVTGDWLTDWQALDAGMRRSDELDGATRSAPARDEPASDEVPTCEVPTHEPPPYEPPPYSAARRDVMPSDAPVAIALDEAAPTGDAHPPKGMGQRLLGIAVIATALLGAGVSLAMLSIPYHQTESVFAGAPGRVGASLGAEPAAANPTPTARIGTTTIVHAAPSTGVPLAPNVAARAPGRIDPERRRASPGAAPNGLETSHAQAGAPPSPIGEASAPANPPDAAREPVPEASEPVPVAQPFDPADARRALAAAAIAADRRCANWSEPQATPVAVTFAPSGHVTTALVTGGPLLGTAAGSCVAQALHGATVSPFEGELVTIRQTITLP
jgi:hypothetical protein